MTTQRVKQELDGFRSAMSRIETTLSQVAGAAQMEMLGLVVEEQRHRIDSILTGNGLFGVFLFCIRNGFPLIVYLLIYNLMFLRCILSRFHCH